MSKSRIIYIEPFSGISGDMMVGALLDLGLDFAKLTDNLDLLPLKGYRLSARKCLRAGIQATKFDVYVEGEGNHHDTQVHHANPPQPHRTFLDIRRMIASSDLSQWVKERATEAFRRLAEAEGKIHGQSVDDVHFHEVGAVDSLVDIVGSMIAAQELLPARFFSSAINIGCGTLQCRHGIYPAPGPATAELLKGIPTYSNGVSGELATPTGAALLVTLVEDFGPRPLMKIQSSGYGAGTQETPGNANVLRITVGEEIPAAQAASPEDRVAVVEASIDDMNPQFYGYFQDTALARGALDVYATPIHMKKNRPGLLVTVVCAEAQLEAMVQLILSETTTIGIRYTLSQRRTLERRFQKVQTEHGAVTIKTSHLGGRCMNFIPEYEDCRRLAVEKGIPLKEIMAAAAQAYLQRDKNRETGEG